MSNLFEEAIADAKKIKEIAEENAKKAILESVTPRIREFIEEQLLQEDKERICEQCNTMYEGEDHICEFHEEKLETLDESSIKELLRMVGGNEIYESLSNKDKKSVINRSINKALSKFNDADQQNLLNISNKINENLESLNQKRINNNVDNIQENNSMSKNEKYYEIDLKMLREAVEEETAALEAADMYDEDDDMDEGILSLDLGDDIEKEDLPDDFQAMYDEEDSEDEGDEEDSEDLEMDMPDFKDPESEGDEEDSEDLEMDMPAEDGKEKPLSEVFDVDPRMLQQELAKIRRQIKEGKMDHHFGGSGNAKAGVNNAFGGSGSKKLGYEKSFGGGSYGKDPFVNPPQINKLNEAIRQLRRMNRSQTEKLNKYRSAVQTLREQLEDLNLFNAKLLYVNKLLQNKSLTESQKKSVIKALDEAKNIGETKALYKSLTESLSSSKGNLNESTRFGSSSRVTTSASGNTAVGELDRWQILAGLKK